MSKPLDAGTLLLDREYDEHILLVRDFEIMINGRLTSMYEVYNTERKYSYYHSVARIHDKIAHGEWEVV